MNFNILMKNNNVIVNICKSSAFIIIFIILAGLLSKLFKPDRNYPYYSRNIDDALCTFLQSDKNSFDVIFLGSSHGEMGISPMEIYEEYGISTYNLCTCGQPIGASYYLLKEAVKRQNLQMVMLDVSTMYRSYDAESWNLVMDNLPFSKNSISMLKDYNYIFDNQGICSFGFLKYHSRWDALNGLTAPFSTNDEYYTAGYRPVIQNSTSTATVELVDERTAKWENEIYWKTIGYEKGARFEKNVACEPMYNPEINDRDYDYLDAIVKICNDKNIKLVLIKIPSVCDPMFYKPTWSKIKHDEIEKVSLDYNIDFIDLQYDVDIGIDNETDWSIDVGHLNWRGAKKVTDYLGHILIDEYGIAPRPNYEFNKKMDAYLQLRDLLELHTVASLNEYVDYISSNLDKYDILFVASGDMTLFIQEVSTSLSGLGLNTDFEKDYVEGDAYAGLVTDEGVQYEAISNRNVFYETSNGGHLLRIESNSVDMGGGSKVIIDKNEYINTALGLNIYLIDKKTYSIVDGAYIWTCRNCDWLEHSNSDKLLADYMYKRE